MTFLSMILLAGWETDKKFCSLVYLKLSYEWQEKRGPKSGSVCFGTLVPHAFHALFPGTVPGNPFYRTE
jgi:hypothetical protein